MPYLFVFLALLFFRRGMHNVNAFTAYQSSRSKRQIHTKTKKFNKSSLPICAGYLCPKYELINRDVFLVLLFFRRGMHNVNAFTAYQRSKRQIHTKI